MISFSELDGSIVWLQVDPETLSSLANPSTTAGKGKPGGGGGGGKGTTGSKPPTLPLFPSSTLEPSKPASTGSEGDTCASTDSLPKATGRPVIYISSDGSDSDSSFPESNVSGEESMETATQTRVKEEREGDENVPVPAAVATPPVSPVGSKVTSPAADGSKEVEELPPGWTGAEVTYFRLLHPIFVHNYCTIAELLRSKSCLEVFHYSQQAGSDLLQDKGTRRFNSKKKKRNMR